MFSSQEYTCTLMFLPNKAVMDMRLSDSITTNHHFIM